MNKTYVNQLGLKLAMLLVVVSSGIASAGYIYNDPADLQLEFRKTSANIEQYEMVVNIGSITNYLNVSPGTTINVTNYTVNQLHTMCPDNLANLQWAVFAADYNNSLGDWTPPGTNTFTIGTLWYTWPRTSISTPTTNAPPLRNPRGTQENGAGLMDGVANGAIDFYNNYPNASNSAYCVLEPYNDQPDDNIDPLIQPNNSSIASFGLSSSTIESVTASPFSTVSVSDLYELTPSGTHPSPIYDPISGSATQAYYIGYFTLNTDGTMTFTRAGGSAPSAPVASFIGSPTAIFVSQSVTFTNTSTGSFSNSDWSFGDGNVTTNSNAGNVSNTYNTAGEGTGGSNLATSNSYVVVKPQAVLGKPVMQGGTNFIFNGTNGPAGAQYRILTATNVAQALVNWTPVFTNTFNNDGTYGFTNASSTNKARFFRLVSP
jgi:PKD repeat protein